MTAISFTSHTELTIVMPDRDSYITTNTNHSEALTGTQGHNYIASRISSNMVSIQFYICYCELLLVAT